MFLFDKKTKNVIKYVWGVFATLIILSMVFTYSGFTRLSGSAQSQPIELSAEELEQIRAQQALTDQQGTSTSNASGTLELTTGTTPVENPEALKAPEEPSVPRLDFSI